MNNKVRVLILGCTGLLGNTVFKEFSSDSKYSVYGTYRNLHQGLMFSMVEGVDCEYYSFDVLKDKVSVLPSNCDYIINCIGLIKPSLRDNSPEYRALKVNGLFPHELSRFAKKHDARLIHVTSDCVFSGNKAWPERWAPGHYTEGEEHDMIDLYGRTKSLGEPENCMVLRTSIIGPEIHSHVSFVDWVKSNDNGTIDGYTNHFWNGVTTKQYANVCKKIIEGDLYQEDMYHVFSPETVCKHMLANMVATRFDLNINIVEHETPIPIDRSLSTTKELNNRLQIPHLYEQLATL